MPSAAKVKPRETTHRQEDETSSREAFLKGLELVSPALASGGDIPAFKHIWFDGTHACAFDGGLGIRVPLPTDFCCGVLGSTLVGLLSSTSAKDVDLKVEEGKHDAALKFRCGKSQATLPVLPADCNPWKFPASPPKNALSLDLTDEMLEGLKRVRVVHMPDPRRTEHYGVVLFPTKSDAELYTTNGTAVAQIIVKQKLSPDLERVVLPHAFVQQVVKHGVAGTSITFADDCILYKVNGMQICSNLLDSSDVPDMPETVTALSDVSGYLRLPENFGEALKRAAVLVGKETPYLALGVEKKEMWVSGEYAFGTMSETLPLAASAPAAEIVVDLKLLTTLANLSLEFAITERALCLLGDDDALFILAAHEEGDRR